MGKRSPLFYERYVLGELSVKKRERYAKQFTDDEKKIIEKIENRNREFREKHSFLSVKNVFEPYMDKEPPESFGDWKSKLLWGKKILIPALSGFIVLVLSLLLFDTGGIRVKGDPAANLIIYRDTGGGDGELLVDSDIVFPGDLLQVGYKSGVGGYGAILSIDGNRSITYHYPRSPGLSLELTSRGEEVVLPYSCRLDDAPVYEMFVFVTSEHPFSTDDLLTEVMGLDPFSGPDVYEIKKWTFKKVLLLKGEK